VTGELWYVAYGSNLLPENMSRYLGEVPEHTALFRLPHQRYYAGESFRWSGGVAFLSLYRSTSGCPGRGYLVTLDQFQDVFRGENRSPDAQVARDFSALEPGQRAVYDVPGFADDPRVGKYNAVLRLRDIDGVQAVTITTARMLSRKPPSPDYLAAIQRGEAWTEPPVTSP